MSSNQFDQQIVDLVNQERAKAGLDPVSFNSELDQAANAHNDRMVQADQMAHNLPGEPGLGDRVGATGYDWNKVSENIAAGSTTPEEVMYGDGSPDSGWMNSTTGHRENILDPNVTSMGVGYESAPDNQPYEQGNTDGRDYDTYWTQVFAGGDDSQDVSATEQPESDVEDDISQASSEAEQPESDVEDNSSQSSSEIEQPESDVEDDISQSSSEIEQPESDVEDNSSQAPSEIEQPESDGSDNSDSGNESDFYLGAETDNSDMSTGDNNFESQVLELINDERESAGLDSLSIDSQLNQVASLHTNEMVQADALSSQPNGIGLSDRIDETGYDGNFFGANIAGGFETPEEVVEGLMNDSQTQANILNPEVMSFGVSYQNSPDDNDSAGDVDAYFTQVFGAEV